MTFPIHHLTPRRWLPLAMLFALMAAVAPQAQGAGSDLQQREIDLLRLRLEQTRAAQKEDHLARLVYETQLQVAALHRFMVHDLLEIAALTPEALQRIFDDSLDEQYPGRTFELYQWSLVVFGALPPDLDMRAFMKDLLEEQAGGVYDPKTKKLYVSEDYPLDGPMGRMILAHEINHALQDQNYDMEQMGVFARNDSDRSTALMCLLEGDATLLMSEHLARYGEPMKMVGELPRMMMMDQQKLMEAPVAVREALLFPYLAGAEFFNTLAGRTRDGRQSDWRINPAWRNAVFADPPVSSEQIMHPEKYLAGEAPAAVDEPAVPAWATASILDVAGEAGIRLMLMPTLGEARARAAAADWNGDRLLVAEDGKQGRRALIWHTRWDTPAAADRFAEALREALTQTPFLTDAVWEADGTGWKGRARNAELTLTRPAGDAVNLTMTPASGPTGETRPRKKPARRTRKQN